MNKFIYFPSFSTGGFAARLQKDYKLKNGLPIRFYSKQFPERYRHPYFLVTAGHNFKKPEYSQTYGFEDSLIMGDSGGFQIASGALKWKPEYRETIFNWLENNAHVSMNLDIPPRLKYNGKVRECLDISIDNFKYFADKQSGKTDFLNVIQGDDEHSYLHWYEQVKDFSFQGWGIGGCGGSLYRFMSGLMAFFSGKEHLKPNNKYLHILGTSKISDFLILSQLQKSISECDSDLIVTTDSSSPSQSVVYGYYYTGFDMKKMSFKSINFPKKNESFNDLAEPTWPYHVEFDTLLKNNVSFDDLYEYEGDGASGMVLHNFMVFKNAMDTINDYVYGHPYLLEQMVSKDMLMVLRSIDEMAKQDNALEVFEKYKPLYTKLSNTQKEVISQHEFF